MLTRKAGFADHPELVGPVRRLVVDDVAVAGALTSGHYDFAWQIELVANRGKSPRCQHRRAFDDVAATDGLQN